MPNPTTCYYHPDARGTASCPNCKQLICDRCRLNGNSRRCGSCESAVRKGETPGGGASKRIICKNHAGIPADMKCVQCQTPYCPACLNTSGRCFRCASSQSAPGAPRRISPTTSLSPRGTGKLSRAPVRVREPEPASAANYLTMSLVALCMFVLGGGAVLLLVRHAPGGPVRGPLHVAIVSPRGKVSGNQDIRLNVSSAEDVSRVDLTVDGKYWDRFRHPPFDSPWPTPLFHNGRHVIMAKVVYRDRREAVAQKDVVVWNKPVQ